MEGTPRVAQGWLGPDRLEAYVGGDWAGRGDPSIEAGDYMHEHTIRSFLC